MADDPISPAHAHEAVPEQPLEAGQAARGLDFLADEYGDFCTHHFGRDRDGLPAHEVGEPCRRAMEWACITHYDSSAAHAIALDYGIRCRRGPSHTGVDTEHALVFGETRQALEYEVAFGFCHAIMSHEKKYFASIFFAKNT